MQIYKIMKNIKAVRVYIAVCCIIVMLSNNYFATKDTFEVHKTEQVACLSGQTVYYVQKLVSSLSRVIFFREVSVWFTAATTVLIVVGKVKKFGVVQSWNVHFLADDILELVTELAIFIFIEALFIYICERLRKD